MDNVIEFPKKTAEIFPANLDESFDHIEDVRRQYCDEVSADIMEAAFSVLSSYGLTVNPNEDTIKQIVFLEEAIKAMVYTTKRLQHPFHNLAEQAITLSEDAKQELEELIDGNLLNP